VQGHGSQHERAPGDVFQSRRTHDFGQRGRAWKLQGGVGQVGVGLLVAAEEGGDAGHEIEEVEMEDVPPDGRGGPGDFQADHTPARAHDPTLLGKRGRHIGDVAHEKPGAGGIEAVVGKGQVQGVGLDKGDAPRFVLFLANAHHLMGEIGSHHTGVGMLAQGLQGDVSGAGGHIQQAATGRKLTCFHYQPPPALILTQGHQPVHAVVAPGRVREHVAHKGGFFFQSGER